MSASNRFDNALRRRPEGHDAQIHLTPEYILEPVRAMLGGRIGLDPCTTPDNPVGALRFYCPPDDGAELAWDAESIYCNPPYGEARIRWVCKCATSGAAGIPTVLLIPAHTDTRIWHEAMRSTSSVLFIRGRVKFGVPRENGRQMAASHPSALVTWNVDISPAMHLGTAMVVAS